MKIQKGKQVSIHYTLKVEDEVIDTSRQKDPLPYVHGEGRIIPGLSHELEGLEAGDTKNVEVKPEDGYGIIDPGAIREVPRSQLPKDLEPQIGMTLQAGSPDGQQQLIRVVGVEESSIKVDLNHPLAGKTLNFDVEVVSVT
jgi:FKBP-type peptidyl-prolyl cis-trans isomerase 2